MSFLYLKADDALPFGNWQGMVPFSYLLECPDMPKDVRYQLSNRVEQISVTMTGSDSVEVKAVLDFDVFLRKEVPMQVITEVSLEETDREELARLLNISDNQLSYITNVDSGRGLIKCGSAIVPFVDSFPRHTRLYQMMTTRPSDLIA